MEYQEIKIQGSPVIMGTISCLADDTRWLDARVEMHKKQIQFLEETTAKMQEKYGVEPIPYFRVEQGWNAEREEALKTSLPITHIKYEHPIPPGAARNQLLKILYESDADWLICMDDDHALYEKFDGYELLWELTTPEFLKLAKEGYIIVGFPAYWDGYMKEVQDWGKDATHWLLKRTKHTGAMPFCCIPNIVKYGKAPIYFDPETSASKGAPPEDLRFTIDWIGAGGKVYECMTMISKSCGGLDKSSIFDDRDNRRDRYEDDKLWLERYLKSKFPRTPALWNKREFLKRKHPNIPIEVPRHFKKEEVK